MTEEKPKLPYDNNNLEIKEESLVERLNRTNMLAKELAGEDNGLPYSKKSNIL